MTAGRALLLAVACAATLHSQAPGVDTFKFRDTGSRTINVTLEDANGAMAMTWPADTGDWDTALLGVEVFSGLPAPFVEVVAAGRSDRQYFNQDDSGRRWINLSFLRGAVSAGARLRVRADGMRLTGGVSPLRLFSNRLDFSRTLLVVAPHPDDAEIAAFGV